MVVKRGKQLPNVPAERQRPSMRLFYFESPVHVQSLSFLCNNTFCVCDDSDSPTKPPAVSAGAGGALHSLTCCSSRTDKHRFGRQWAESYETYLTHQPPKTTTPMIPCCSCLWREMAGGVHTQVLPMSSVVPVDEEQRVSAVNLTGPCRAFWDLEFLAVSGEQKAIILRQLHTEPLATSGTFGSGRAS